MTNIIEEVDVSKLAKALIVNHGTLWLLLCGEYKEQTRIFILEKIQALGIEPGSQLYQDIERAICTKETINDRSIHWSHDLLICDVEGLISEVITLTCQKTCINTIRVVE